MLHFLTGGLFQAIGYACMRPKAICADDQRRRGPPVRMALVQRTPHGGPWPRLETPRTCAALRMRAWDPACAGCWESLICMPEKESGRGTLALTSAATMAGCACIPRVLAETRRQPMVRVATACREVESPFEYSRDLHDAGIGARRRTLRRATSGWGLARCPGESAMGIILPVVVK